MATWELASRLEHQGEWDAARGAYHDLFWARLRSGDTTGAVDALRGGARVLHRRGSYEHAFEMAQLSREIALRGGLLRAAARAHNVMAVIRHSQDEWVAAEALYEEAMESALDVGDDELIGLICQNLGVLANIRGDLREARIRYLESIASFVRSGSERNAAITYNNLGMVCADLTEWFEAEIYFDRGIEIAERLGGFAHHLASLYTNRTETLLRRGELEKAAEMLDRAEEIATRIAAHTTLVDIARFRAMLARLEGDPEGAERHLADALRLADDARILIGRGEVVEEMAVLRRQQGRHREARELLSIALDTFRHARAERDANRVEETLRAMDADPDGGLPRAVAPA